MNNQSQNHYDFEEDHHHHHDGDCCGGTPHVNSNKVGRNDLCHCGSGKKYKKCCIDM
jgi:uncharacterized protein YecA (UPF0149 family)